MVVSQSSGGVRGSSVSLSRPSIELRDAVVADAADLAELWRSFMPRSMAPADDMVLIIKRVQEEPAERILVATRDGAFAGAIYLEVGRLSPLDPEPVLSLLLPQVADAHRRHGIGHALMEAGVQHAETLGITHVRSGSANNNRAAHRFLARLALSPVAVLRAAPTHVVRARLSAKRPHAPGAARGSLASLLAQRRSQRRDHVDDAEPRETPDQ